MPVNLSSPNPSHLHAIDGIRIGVTEAGIKKVGRKDLTVMLLDPGASVGAVFTTNRFSAAPVQLSREHLSGSASIRAIVINTGNANAGTGEDGLLRARRTCQALAEKIGIDEKQVLPFSTGVIMEALPVDRLVQGLPAAVANAQPDHWMRAAEGIMTTDTVPKAASAHLQIDGKDVYVTGVSKGAGMIRPNMATMLGFIGTNACVSQALMHQLTLDVAEDTFNRITVDGDTSTNDSLVVIASNQAGHAVIESWASASGRALRAAVMDVAKTLAQAIVRDGEGATKFITVEVAGGRNEAECRLVAYAVAHSPLVKTAFFASDPNLGRILAAVGYAGIEDLDQSLIELHLDDVHVVTRGGRHPAYEEAAGQRVMRQAEIVISVHLGRGDSTQTVWTCDLSHDYVTINADYRS